MAPKKDDERRANAYDAMLRYGLGEAFIACPTLTKLRILGYRHWLLREEGDEKNDEKKDEDGDEPKLKLAFFIIPFAVWGDFEPWEDVFQ